MGGCQNSSSSRKSQNQYGGAHVPAHVIGPLCLGTLGGTPNRDP